MRRISALLTLILVWTVSFISYGQQTYNLATEQARKDHMVQYIHHPEFTWYYLRENRTMEFENEIPDPPDPNQWFNAKIVVSEKNVEVFLENIVEPVLVVERLAESRSKKIGLWTGNGSSGRFRDLILTK
jgi:hypothetical protein